MLLHKDDLLKVLFYTFLIFVFFLTIKSFSVGGVKELKLSENDLIFLIVNSVLFGLFFTLQIHNYKHEGCNKLEKNNTFLQKLFNFIKPICPVHLSLSYLMLPLTLIISLIGFLNQTNSILTLSIFLMIIGLYLLGGFEN